VGSTVAVLCYLNASQAVRVSVRASAAGGAHSLFQALRTWFDRWRAFRALSSAEIRDSVELRATFTTEIDLASRAFKQGDREQAVKIWRQIRARFPGLSAISEAALRLALDLGYYDEAEAMLRAGHRYHPGRKAFFAMGLARVAQRRGNPEEAIRRCKTLLRKFPATADGYHLAATCLSELGRQDEADAITARGVLKAPTDFKINVRYAQQAVRRRTWPDALRRWELMQGRFEDIAVPLGIAKCLWEMGRFAEAEVVLTEAGTRYGVSDRLLAELANLATAKGNFDEAVQCWKSVVRQFPSFASAYTKAAEAMRKIGQEAEADELLCVAVTRFPANLAIHLEYARSAHRRHDWAVATERWSLVRGRFPECVVAQQQGVKALEAAERQGSPTRH
jgi:tetratricopeptide (TPR) repeat protein